MRTLTDVFTPGAPTIPEGLRTLAVSPERELEPGMTVLATFTFRNQGGAAATGVRVKFNLPDGLVYLVGTGQLDGADLDDEHGNSPLLARAGAEIGEIAAGQERRIDIAYSVAGAIENGSIVELQAAVAAFELPPVGSNVVRLVARSRPTLENALTNITIETRAHEPRPGGEATVTLRIHNAGESSAHDLAAVAPIPEYATYVPNSARINGREFERDLLAPFDRVHAPIIAAALPASATVTLQYRIRIDEPLRDGTAITARASIASQETAAFDVDPAVIVVHALPDFEGEQTVFEMDPSKDAAPGTRVRLRLYAYNAGTAAAQNVSVALTLDDGLIPVRGATCVDGAPLRERKKEGVYDLGTIPARASAEFRAEAALASPLPDAGSLLVRAVLQWEGGRREFEETLVVASRPYVNSRRNGIERNGGAIVRPSEECEAVVTIANDGSAAATDAVLHLRVDPGLDDLRALDKTMRLPIENDSVELGSIEPYASRRVIVRARVRTPYPDRSELRLRASLHSQEMGETPLGEVLWRVDSHPAFSAATSVLSLATDDLFRPNQLVDIYVRLRNEGTDAAQNVRLRLYVSPEARVESVEGATRERSELIFGEIAPGASAEARMGLRLLRSLAKAHPVTIESVISADAMLPIPLARVSIVTMAEPSFAIGTLRSEPDEAVDAGDEVEYVLHLRNSGDGPARHVRVSTAPIDALIYVPNSTSVNDLPMRDVGAQSALCSERGLIMTDVDPGIEATIRWREVVHNGLPSGEALLRSVRIEYDGDRVDTIDAPELKVRCAPAFAGTIPGLPFGVDGMLGPSFGGHQRALTGDARFVELPPATPVPAPISLAPNASNGNGQSVALQSPQVEPAANEGVQLIAAFDRERLDRALHFLEEARFGGLVWHLFAIRVLFPDAVGARDQSALQEVRETLRETLDRLFIKLRLPNYVIAPRDLETPAARAALDALLGTLDASCGAPALAGSVVLRAGCDEVELRALRERLTQAPLAGSLFWAILARLLPAQGDALRNYREMLVAVLDELVTGDEHAFVDALQRRSYPVLAAALDVVRTQLANALTL